MSDCNYSRMMDELQEAAEADREEWVSNRTDELLAKMTDSVLEALETRGLSTGMVSALLSSEVTDLFNDFRYDWCRKCAVTEWGEMVMYGKVA